MPRQWDRVNRPSLRMLSKNPEYERELPAGNYPVEKAGFGVYIWQASATSAAIAWPLATPISDWFQTVLPRAPNVTFLRTRLHAWQPEARIETRLSKQGF